MTSRERVLAVFAGEIPDRVPAWLGASPEWKALAKARAGLATDEELSLFVGDDFRRVFAKYAGPPEYSPDSFFSHPEATARTPFGVERTGYGYGQPVNHPLAEARTVADIERYPWPDPAWMDVSRVRDEALAWGGRFAVLGGDWSPFYHDAIDLLGMETFMVMLVENPAVVDDLLRRLVDYYFQVSLRIFEAAAGVHRRLLHRQRLRHPERARRRRRPLSPLLPAPPRPPGRPRPRLRAKSHAPLLRRVLPAHPGHDRSGDRRAPGPPARRPGHGPGQAQGGVRRPCRLQRVHRYPPLAHPGDAGARAGEDEGDARRHEAGRRLHRLAEPRLPAAGNEGRERLRPLRNDPRNSADTDYRRRRGQPRRRPGCSPAAFRRK